VSLKLLWKILYLFVSVLVAQYSLAEYYKDNWTIVAAASFRVLKFQYRSWYFSQKVDSQQYILEIFNRAR